jgi:hypothetical protein
VSRASRFRELMGGIKGTERQIEAIIDVSHKASVLTEYVLAAVTEHNVPAADLPLILDALYDSILKLRAEYDQGEDNAAKPGIH